MYPPQKPVLCVVCGGKETLLLQSRDTDEITEANITHHN